MPEVKPENLSPYRQCEIRRPSPVALVDIGDRVITKPAGYYFDVVWLDPDVAVRGNEVADDRGHTWTVAEVYGTRLMPRPRVAFKLR